MKQENNKVKKRVSFLMPYIDFCFMLIIIFVGMLSIAYFEPLGRTDIETKSTKEINQRPGKFEIKPGGINENKTGVGEKQPTETLRPLVSNKDTTPPPLVARTNSNRPNLDAAQKSGSKPDNYINPAELEKLKKIVEEQRAEIERLKQSQKDGSGGSQPPSTGNGNNYYIDLRSK